MSRFVSFPDPARLSLKFLTVLLFFLFRNAATRYVLAHSCKNLDWGWAVDKISSSDQYIPALGRNKKKYIAQFWVGYDRVLINKNTAGIYILRNKEKKLQTRAPCNPRKHWRRLFFHMNSKWNQPDRTRVMVWAKFKYMAIALMPLRLTVVS